MSELTSPFDALMGNQRVKQFLLKLHQSNRVGNSLLFSGPEGVGKALFATAFAKLLLGAYPHNEQALYKIDRGSHPDLRHFHPEGKLALHSVESLRQFSHTALETPFEAPRRVFIFHDAERMQPVSANALLKTFEEPALDSIIILLSSTAEKILPTIRSRCRVVPFTALAQAEVAGFLSTRRAKTPLEATALAALFQGSLGRALQFVDHKGEEIREQTLKLLAQGSRMTPPELQEALKALAELLEIEEPEIEKKEELTAYLREQQQKEAEGSLALQKQQHLQTVFEIILSWHRDLSLLRHHGNVALLYNPDKLECLQQAQKAKLLPIETVYRYLEEAQQALERSTGMALILEGLFLKLL